MHPRRATSAARGAIALVLLVLVLGWAGPAEAHEDLVRSTPENGAEVSPTTERVILVLSGEVSRVGNEVVVRDPEGRDVTSGPARVSDNTLEIGIDLESSGRHTVAYRFVGADGHAVTGLLPFTVAADDAPHSAATAPPPPALLPSDDPSAAAQGVTEAASAAPDVSPVRWVLLLCLVGGLALVSGVSRLQARPVRQRSARPRRRPGS